MLKPCATPGMCRFAVTRCVLVAATLIVAQAGQSQEILWDNQDVSGICSYSQLTMPRRSTLDDFDVDGDGWVITSFDSLQQWNTLPPGSGTGYELRLRENIFDPGFGEDEGPGQLIGEWTTAGYEEIATGRFWFARPEFNAIVDLEPSFLPAGRYWLDMRILGPENCWMLCAGNPIVLNGGWVDYADVGGLQPTRWIFGQYREGSFRLSGFRVGVPTESPIDQITPVIFQGQPVGTIDDIAASDDQYYIITAGQGVRISRPQTSIVEFTALMPDISVQEIGLRLESSTDRPAVRQVISLFDSDTNRWVMVDDQPLSRDQDMTVSLDNLKQSQRFYDHGVVRMRVEAYAPGVSVIQHQLFIDEAKLLVTADSQ